MALANRPISLRNCSEILSPSILALAVAFVLISPLPAMASTAVPFPRLADWWGDSSPADNALRDYYVPHSDTGTDSGAIATLRALNPNIILLASATAAEVNYSPVNDRAVDAKNIGAIPTSWLLTQVGSSLSSPLTSTSTPTISVADTSKFRVKDLVIIDDERCLVTSIASGALTVSRGFAGSTAATHTQGTRVAAVVSAWPYAATLDMTAKCPLGRAAGAFATPGTGTERAADWLARRTTAIYAAAAWDGVLIDVCVADYSHALRNTTSFRTIADRAAPTAEVDYAAFDRDWQSGIEAFLSQVRARVGDKAVIMTNEAPPVFATANGTCFEGWPTGTTTPFGWHEAMIGPAPHSRGAYLDWTASAKTPNLTTIMTYGGLADYRLMRFGLTTSLMGDGYYSYEQSANGHGSNGRWYDEYDNAGAGKGYLGQPLGPADSVTPQSTTDLLSGDGAFDSSGQLAAWALGLSDGTVAAARTLDAQACKVQVTSAGANWKVDLRHAVSVTSGTTYRVTLRAKASARYSLNGRLNDGTSSSYFNQLAQLTTEWRDFSAVVSATHTGKGYIDFYFGDFPGTIWLDNVRLVKNVPEAWRRDFDKGVALVNAETTTQTVTLGGTFRKIKGTQAPLVNDGSLVTAVTLPPKDGIVLLRPAPTGRFTVAGGAACVDSPSVTCVSNVIGASEMRIDPGTGTFGDWRPYAPSVPATLAGGYGTNTVRVEYRNPTGSLLLTATVELRQQPVAPTGDFALAGGADQTTVTAVPVASFVVDATEMRFNVDGGAWSSWSPYASASQVTLPGLDNASHTVSAEYRSQTGDVLAISHSILAMSPDAVQVSLLVAVPASRNVALSWALAPSALRPVAYEVERRQGGASWSCIATVTSPATDYTDSSPTNRTTYVYRVRVLDELGQLGPCSSEVVARPRATIQRLAGITRASTAVAASRSAFATGTAGAVVLATDGNYADALTAASLAGAFHGPVLLVGRAGLDAGLIAEITRLGVPRAFVIGGTAAVPRTVTDGLSLLGLSVERIAGADRYDTAAAVARRVHQATGVAPREVFVVTGASFADALSVSPVAYARCSPILLTRPTRVPPVTSAALGVLRPEHVIVVGGTGAVSLSVQALLTPAGDTGKRVAGVNRYATSALLAREAVGQGWVSERVAYVATGRSFPDALGAGPAAGERGGPLLLTESASLPPSVRSAVDGMADHLDSLEMIGGPGAVRGAVFTALDSILR